MRFAVLLVDVELRFLADDEHLCIVYCSLPQDRIGECKSDIDRITPHAKMLRLVPVTRDNFEEVIELCVSPEQERFVGTPAEALAYWHFYPERVPFAIELGTQLIGLVMYDIASAPDVLRLQRLLIDCAHQRRGYARRILALIVERARRAGKARVELAVHRDASAAIALYTAFGFILNNNDSDHFDATYAVSAL